MDYKNTNAGKISIFSGRSNQLFSEKIAESADIPLGHVEIKNFSDGEIWVKYISSIRGDDVYIIQPTNPPAENLMELLIMIDAAKRASAKKVTAVIPYFGYARQDRKDQPCVSITAKLVANLITKAGADRIITIDLHAAQIQGFFDIPVDHLFASAIFLPKLEEINIPNLTVVSPDIGGIKLARAYAKRLGAELVVIDKRRPEQGKAEVMNIIGDVKGRNILIADDLIDTAGTFNESIKALINAGAKDIYGVATHPLFSNNKDGINAVDLIDRSGLKKLFVTNSIQLKKSCDKIEIVSASSLFATAIIRAHNHQSISSLFAN